MIVIHAQIPPGRLRRIHVGNVPAEHARAVLGFREIVVLLKSDAVPVIEVVTSLGSRGTAPH
jgi:hypothetical protein